MDIFGTIAERKIREAMENGEFDKIEGSGKPLVFEDESHIPEDVKIAYKVLKNAGCIPPELELRKEIIGLRDLITTLDDDKERLKRIRELNFKVIKFNMMRERPLYLGDITTYEAKIIEKFVG